MLIYTLEVYQVFLFFFFYQTSLTLPPSLPPSLHSSPIQVGKWTAKEEHALHSTSKPGVLALDVSPLEERLLVTGGADKEAVVFDRQVGREGGREGGGAGTYVFVNEFLTCLTFLPSLPPSLPPLFL